MHISSQGSRPSLCRLHNVEVWGASGTKKTRFGAWKVESLVLAEFKLRRNAPSAHTLRWRSVRRVRVARRAELVLVEDAEHLLRGATGIDLAVGRARLASDAVVVLAHILLEPLDDVLAERVGAAADLDGALGFGAPRHGAVDELLVAVRLHGRAIAV